MASKSNIVILTNPYELYHVVSYPKTASAVIAPGDLLKDDGSGSCTPVTATANDTFIGVAVTGSTAAETEDITVMIKGVIQAKIHADSVAAGTFGATFGWGAGANGTDWQLKSMTAEGIVWALEAIEKEAYGKFLVDVPALETGIFEATTATSTSTSTSTSSTTTSTSTSTSTTTA